MMRELEKRTGVAGAFIESDLVDHTTTSHANVAEPRRELPARAGARRPAWRRPPPGPRLPVIGSNRGLSDGRLPGIEVESTTSKAVLVDSDGRLLGRGITNTRSNYDTWRPRWCATRRWPLARARSRWRPARLQAPARGAAGPAARLRRRRMR